MQRDVQAQVLQVLQAATGERDINARLRLFQQSQEILLHADTRPETTEGFIDFFVNLKADPHVALRRFAASFLDRLMLLKPTLTLRCSPAVAGLLEDKDAVVEELAARAARTLHGRALHLLALEEDKLRFQQHFEQLQEVRDITIQLLLKGCDRRPGLFRQVTRWARTVVLVQTPSPLMLRIRVPPELRGACCLQDFPIDPALRLDLDAMRRQAEELYQQICKLIEEPPQGRWSRSHLTSIVRCAASIGRQRPSLLPPLLEIFRRLMKDATAVLDGLPPQGALPVPPVDAGHLRQLLWDEAQRLLASNVASCWHGDIVELLHAGSGVSGPFEDLAAQAKYQQIVSLGEKRSGAENGKPPPKRARLAEKLAWEDAETGGGEGKTLVGADEFDADAILCGEAEYACRRFEDYFGLPSQREPAGHVSGPALLATRTGNTAELARLALTSLNSLAEKRFALRDRFHERAVVFAEPVLRKASGNNKKESTVAASPAMREDLAIFLSAAKGDDEGEEESVVSGRDPRAAQARGPTGRRGDSVGAGGDHQLLSSSDIGAARLPTDTAGRDSLQLQIYGEVLESQRRMDSSLLRASLSERQLEAFERVSRQVALHLASQPTAHLAVGPGLQRLMCRAFMRQSLDALKVALDNKTTAASAVAQSQLAELFFAKYSADVARSQAGLGLLDKPATEATTATPLGEILEGNRTSTRSGVFTYAELFDMFIKEFEARELPRRELRSLFGELPAIPAAAFRLLEAQCKDEKPRKVALMTLLSLLESRPSCRWQSIQLLFRMAYSGGGAEGEKNMRFDTIRLIINKIYNAGSQPPMRWQLPHLNDAEAVPLLGGAEAVIAAAAAAQAPDDPIALPRLRGRVVEDLATLMLRSMAKSDVDFRFQVQASKRVQQLRASLFEGEKLCIPEDRMWLYLALCIKRPVLLHGLVETFTHCGEEMQAHFISSVEEAIKHIPASEPELLTLVQKATQDTERLVLKVLHILIQTTKEGLSKAFGEAVTRLYGVSQNPRLLVPVFDLLDRRNLLEFLPAVLQLEKDQVTDAFGQLVKSKSPPLSITELLTELHHMNKPSENIIPVKASMQGLNVIFSMKEKFDAKVYGIVIQSLVEEPGPLPTLFMRTVIQVVKEIPRLSDFIVMEILPRLVRQEVWSDENMWRGFMIVLQHTFTSQPGGAARVLAMLPSSHLEDVLVQHPDWKAQLVEFVARQPPGTVPPHVRQLLQ